MLIHQVKNGDTNSRPQSLQVVQADDAASEHLQVVVQVVNCAAEATFGPEMSTFSCSTHILNRPQQISASKLSCITTATSGGPPYVGSKLMHTITSPPDLSIAAHEDPSMLLLYSAYMYSPAQAIHTLSNLKCHQKRSALPDSTPARVIQTRAATPLCRVSKRSL